MSHRSRDSECPVCRSPHIQYNEVYGYYQCLACEQLWADAEDDPDYDEIVDHSNSITILEMGHDSDGRLLLRFMSTLPGETLLENGLTINEMYELMRKDLAEKGSVLVRD